MIVSELIGKKAAIDKYGITRWQIQSALEKGALVAYSVKGRKSHMLSSIEVEDYMVAYNRTKGII